jgi:hypothetical protein
LAARVSDVIERLGASEQFPKSEFILHESGHALVEVIVTGPRGTAWSSSARGIQYNVMREARRLRSALERGASQFPRGWIGAVVLDVGRYTSLAAVRTEVERWFDSEGSNYPEAVGVVLVGEAYVETGVLQAIGPVWRGNAPRRVKGKATWQRFAQGINWIHAHVAAFRASRAG